MATTDQDDDVIRVTIDEKEYSIHEDDLTIGELELVEDELDLPLEEVDFTRPKALRVLVYLLMHRDNDSFTMGDASNIKMGALRDPAQNGNGNADGAGGAKAKSAKAKRPTKAAASRG